MSLLCPWLDSPVRDGCIAERGINFRMHRRKKSTSSVENAGQTDRQIRKSCRTWSNFDGHDRRTSTFREACQWPSKLWWQRTRRRNESLIYLVIKRTKGHLLKRTRLNWVKRTKGHLVKRTKGHWVKRRKKDTRPKGQKDTGSKVQKDTCSKGQKGY